MGDGLERERERHRRTDYGMCETDGSSGIGGPGVLGAPSVIVVIADIMRAPLAQSPGLLLPAPN